MAYAHPQEITVTVNEIGQAHMHVVFGYEPMERTLVLSPDKAAKLYHDLGRALGIEQFPPASVITADDLSPDQMDEFREQVDLALADPEYRLITNFPIQVIELADDVKVVDP